MPAPQYVSFREKSGQGGSVDGGFVRRYTRDFIIEVDSPEASVWFVGSHPSLPKIFDPHPDDHRAFCVGISPKQRDDNPRVWDVSTTWNYSLDVAGGITPTGNPLIDEQQAGKPPAERKEAPLIRGNDYSYSVIPIGKKVVESDTKVTVTVNGKEVPKPIRNTLGDLLPTLPERDKYALKISVGMNMIGAPNHEWDILCGKLNSNTVTIGTRTFAPGKVMLVSITSDLVYEDTHSYWRWKLEFMVMSLDPKEWMWKPINRGARGKHTPVDVNGVKGAPVIVPWSVASKTNEGGLHDLDANGFFIELLNPKPAVVQGHQLEFNIHEFATYPGTF